jgi:hypothetical protein
MYPCAELTANIEIKVHSEMLNKMAVNFFIFEPFCAYLLPYCINSL